jgi:hypothetical protein
MDEKDSVNRCLFKVSAVYDRETYQVLVKLMLHKLHRLPRILLLLTGCMTIVLTGYRMITVSDRSLAVILLMILGDAVFLFALFAEPFLVQMLMAENPSGVPCTLHYDIFDDRITVISGDGRIINSVLYPQISRIFDYMNYYIIFTGNRSVYLMDQRRIRFGSKASLAAFLTEKRTRSGPVSDMEKS